MQLEHMFFSYNSKHILTDFSLTLPDTGITALSGPSGCGKTTLLRLIAGLERAQGGQITGLQSSSFLFQENRLLSGLDCIQQVKVVLADDVNAQVWLDAVGLGSETHTGVEALSGGMQRRLSLARCLAYGQDKDWLLLDEPFTGIDSDCISEIMQFIRKQNKPVLFTAHDAFSLSLADRVIHLDGPPLSYRTNSLLTN